MYDKFNKNNEKCLFLLTCMLLFNTHVKSDCIGLLDCLKLFVAGDDISDTSDNVIKVFNISETIETSSVASYDDFFNEASSGLIQQTNSLLDFFKNMFSIAKENPVIVNYTVFNTNLTTTYNYTTDVSYNYTWLNKTVFNDNYSSNKTWINTTIFKKYSYLNSFPNIKQIFGKDEHVFLTKSIYNDIIPDFKDEIYKENEDNYKDKTNYTIDHLTKGDVGVTSINKNENFSNSKVNKIDNISSFYPGIHNASSKKVLNKDHLKTLTKLITEELIQDFDDEIYKDVEDNSTDYSIIDYVELYKDTINELILPPTTHNIIGEHNFVQTTTEAEIKLVKVNNVTIMKDINNKEVTTENAKTQNKPKTQTQYAIRNNTKTKNKESDNAVNKFLDTRNENNLNDVLDDYIYIDTEENSATDYPDIDYYATYTAPTLDTFTTLTEDPELEATTDGFAFLSLPAEAVSICKDRRSITIERTVGLPSDEENYWDGIFDSRRYGGLKKIELIFELTVPVNITEVDNGIGERINETTFFIRGQNVSERISFKVKALPGETFPFLKKVTLNGKEICKERRPWHPSINGPEEQAVVSPLDSPHLTGPYYCGRNQIDFTPLVVKGLPTKEGDYPWHVALFSKNTVTKNWDYQCGGTILYRKTIITAAHCVTTNGITLNKEHLLVIVGKYRLYEVDMYQKAYKIKEIIVHENYTHEGRVLENDLALLILEEHMEYGRYVQPICTWNKEQASKEIIYQEFGTVVGWGATENETLSETLLAAPMKVIPDTICLRSRPSFYRRYLNQNTFCAGNKNGTSACNGDSGGGLIFPITENDGKSSWYLRGVVSAGVRRPGGLCDPNHYVVFADVAQYVDWIEEHQKL